MASRGPTGVAPAPHAGCHRLDDQAQPQQRIGERVGQELGVEVDHRERDQQPRERQRRQRRHTEAEAPGDEAREQAGGELHERIPRADRCLAVGALAAQRQPAHHRNVLQGGDRRLAFRARRAWRDDVVCRLRGDFAAGEQRAFGAQFVVHHDGHAMDHDIEEAADQQAQHHAQRDEQRRMCGESFEEADCCDIKVPIEKRRAGRGVS